MSARSPSCESFPEPRPPRGFAGTLAQDILARQFNEPGASDVEAEVEDVAVLDGVVLALEPQPAGIPGTRLAVQGDVVVVGDGFGPDEAFLEIGMDDAGGLRALVAAPHCP